MQAKPTPSATPAKDPTASWRSRAILMLCHYAGMIDLIALPVWVGVLVQYYGFDLEHAGMTVTAFLVGAVLASVVVAPIFNLLSGSRYVVGGYALAALAFLLASRVDGFAAMAGLHFVAGVAAGTALSVTHGTIGRSSAPHRLFALVGAALGVGAVIFYAAVPPAIRMFGGSALFYVFATLMALGALSALGFPQAVVRQMRSDSKAPLTRAAWFAIGGVALMALNQALTYSMVDRIGIMRGFGQEQVNQLLIICGLVSLVPAPLAGLLEKRLAARKVALVAAPLQAALAVTITLSTGFGAYALAAALYSSVLIFTHTFMFGLIARLDPSGRALASTPAMMMAGSAIGPALAGSVAMRSGFNGQAVLAVMVGALATCMFALVAKQARKAPAETASYAG